MKNSILIKNCSLYNSSNDELIDILILDGKIKETGKFKDTINREEIDAGGRIICPGFIDIHIQGAGGSDVLDDSFASLKTISKTVARFGTTSFLATTLFRTNGNNHHLQIASESVNIDLGGAHLLGIHLEGPFISLNKKGMIISGCICKPSLNTLEDIINLTNGSLKMMTIAPELNGSLDIINNLVKNTIIPSFGHSNASYTETIKGITAGISHVTHLFNAMPSIHHRNPGPLLIFFLNDKITVQVISDGVHIHPEVVKLAFNIIGKDRWITITDGIQSMGLPDGKYIYNGLEYESKNGTARYIDGTLIGTTLGMIQLILNLIEITGCSFWDAVQTASLNPAKLLGIDDKKGSIERGKDADLVILDFDNSVWKTMVEGKIVYQKAVSF